MAEVSKQLCEKMSKIYLLITCGLSRPGQQAFGYAWSEEDDRGVGDEDFSEIGIALGMQ